MLVDQDSCNTFDDICYQFSFGCPRVLMFVLEPRNYEQQVSLCSNLNYNNGLLIKFFKQKETSLGCHKVLKSRE